MTKTGSSTGMFVESVPSISCRSVDTNHGQRRTNRRKMRDVLVGKFILRINIRFTHRSKGRNRFRRRMFCTVHECSIVERSKVRDAQLDASYRSFDPCYDCRTHQWIGTQTMHWIPFSDEDESLVPFPIAIDRLFDPARDLLLASESLVSCISYPSLSRMHLRFAWNQCHAS